MQRNHPQMCIYSLLCVIMKNYWTNVLNTLYKSICWWWLYYKYPFGLADHPTVKTVFSFSDPTDLILMCACATGPRAYLWVWGRSGRRETRPRPPLRPSPAPTARPRAMVWGRSALRSWRAPVRTCNAAHSNEQMNKCLKIKPFHSSLSRTKLSYTQRDSLWTYRPMTCSQWRPDCF